MNLVIIPFHDWRKSESEGFRTRDVHFIKSLSNNPEIDKILVVNRPSTWLEFLYKKQSKNLTGEIVLKEHKFSLTKVSANIYVTDYYSKDVIGQFIKRHLWFIEKYDDSSYLNFINKAFDILNIENHYLINQNIFSYKLANKLKSKRKLFDAWDNFLKFPAYQKIKQLLEDGYRSLAENMSIWTTNSQENINFYKSKFNISNIDLIKNGVKTNFIANTNQVPEDLKDLKKPIIGFGGKVSYLLNYNLINFITNDNPSASFVFVGQILNKDIFNKINKRDNVYFLGDKHYNDYPNYVQNFDICIVPYNINEGQHGGDSMKAYEYLLTNKKVVGTKGNGLLDLEKHIYLVDNKKEFSIELKNIVNQKPPMNIKDHSWETKTNSLIQIIKKS